MEGGDGKGSGKASLSTPLTWALMHIEPQGSVEQNGTKLLKVSATSNSECHLEIGSCPLNSL